MKRALIQNGDKSSKHLQKKLGYEDIAIARLSTMIRFNEAQTEQSPLQIIKMDVSKRHADFTQTAVRKMRVELDSIWTFYGPKIFYI